MKTVEITLEEIQMATRPNIYKNRKAYNRKRKHKSNSNGE
jgi:hypothetical protein